MGCGRSTDPELLVRGRFAYGSGVGDLVKSAMRARARKRLLLSLLHLTLAWLQRLVLGSRIASGTHARQAPPCIAPLLLLEAASVDHFLTAKDLCRRAATRMPLRHAYRPHPSPPPRDCARATSSAAPPLHGCARRCSAVLGSTRSGWATHTRPNDTAVKGERRPPFQPAAVSAMRHDGGGGSSGLGQSTELRRSRSVNGHAGQSSTPPSRRR